MPATALIYPHFARAALDFLGSLAKGACHESIETRSTSPVEASIDCGRRRLRRSEDAHHLFGNERTIRGLNGPMARRGGRSRRQ
jgi:hypothetical protein